MARIQERHSTWAQQCEGRLCQKLNKYCTRRNNIGTLNKFNTHTLGVINLTLVPGQRVEALSGRMSLDGETQGDLEECQTFPFPIAEDSSFPDGNHTPMNTWMEALSSIYRRM